MMDESSILIASKTDSLFSIESTSIQRGQAL